MAKNLSRRILDFMEIQPNTWFTPKNIAIALNEATNSVSKSLSRLSGKYDSVDRDTIGNGFRYKYTPNFQISPAIGTDLEWRGVLPEQMLINDTLSEHQKEILLYIERFFDPRKPMMVHGIKLYADFRYNSNKRGFGSDSFEFNGREVKVTFTDGSATILLKSSYDPLDYREVRDFFNQISFMESMGYFSHSDRKENRGDMSNIGVMQIEYNQDSRYFELDTDYIGLEIMKRAWGRIELAMYQKKTKAGAVLRKEEKHWFRAQDRVSFEDALTVMLNHGQELYNNVQVDSLLEIVTKIVTDNNESVVTLVENVEKLAAQNSDMKEFLTTLPQVLSQLGTIEGQNSDFLKKVINNQLNIEYDLSTIRYTTDEVLRQNSVNVRDTVSDRDKFVTLLSEDVYEVYKRFETARTVDEVAELINRSYKYVWNRLRKLRDKGLVKATSSRPKKFRWTL